MSKLNIIECRQSDASSTNPDVVNNPCDFRVNFKEKLRLDDGDEITIKQVYIDSRKKNKSTDRIIIDDTNDEWNMNHGIYFTDHYANSDLTASDDRSFSGGAAYGRPRGFNYVLSMNKSGENCVEIKALSILKGNIKSFKPFGTRIQITNAHGVSQVINVQILAGKSSDPNFDKGGSISSKDLLICTNTETRTFGPIVLKPRIAPDTGGGAIDNFDIDNLDFLFLASEDFTNVGLGDFITSPPAGSPNLSCVVKADSLFGTRDPQVVIGGTTLLPYTMNASFKIPHNSYEPETLAKFLTDKLSSTNWKQTVNAPNFSTPPQWVEEEDRDSRFYAENFATKTPYMTSIKQLQTDADYGLSPESKIFFQEEGGFSAVEFARGATNDYLIGTNQLSIVYDEGLDKFVFQQFHMPILTGSSASVCVRFAETPGSTPNNFFTAVAHAGIYWASAGSSKCHNLLFNTLGFDQSLIMEPPTTNSQTDLLPDLPSVQTYSLTFSVGNNVTGGLNSIDDFFQKDSTDFNKAIAMAAVDIETENLNSVVAQDEKGAEVGSLKSAYYLVEISGLPDITKVNSDESNSRNNKIKSIVSKYYATTDYTSDQGAGSLSYIHSGVTQYIDDLNIRILNPDMTPANDIGQDNTVFLEHIKAQKNN